VFVFTDKDHCWSTILGEIHVIRLFVLTWCVLADLMPSSLVMPKGMLLNIVDDALKLRLLPSVSSCMFWVI
jgi:hypothetical protein